MCLIFDFFVFLIILFLVASVIFYFLKKKKKNIINILVLFVFCVAYSYSVSYIVKNILPKHQSDRIMVVLGQKNDPYGIGYNVIQSKIAIGSGGFFLEKDFLKGLKQDLILFPSKVQTLFFVQLEKNGGFQELLYLYLYILLYF